MKLLSIRENVPLAPMTTLAVGGPARYLATVTTAAEVRRAVEFAGSRQLPLFILGGGSNLVVADSGFHGLVVKTAIRGINATDCDGKRVYDVGAGEDWDTFVSRTVLENCAGLECLSGIPGTVGGTPVQNVGAYGQEVSETILNVQALDLHTGEVQDMCNKSCGFAYRSSVFNGSKRDRFMLLRVRYGLQPNGVPTLKYRELRNFFAGRQALPSLAEVREAVRQIRRGKAMLIEPGDDDCRSAGSFFKNPVVTAEKFREVVAIAASRGRQVPSFPAKAGKVKLAAAWLVEQSGFVKGYSQGPVGISRKHALAIVNRGGARAEDVVALKNAIQEAVGDQFGIELTPEPVFVGF